METNPPPSTVGDDDLTDVLLGLGTLIKAAAPVNAPRRHWTDRWQQRDTSHHGQRTPSRYGTDETPDFDVLPIETVTALREAMPYATEAPPPRVAGI